VSVTINVCKYCKDVGSVVGWYNVDSGVGCAPKICDEAGGTDPGCVYGRAVTDDLAAVIGDCCIPIKSGMGLVSSYGSIQGLVGRTSADHISLRKVTSESVDNSCIMA